MKHVVSDDELVLFHYRDGLSASRLREIEVALADDASVRTRLDTLKRLLAAADDVLVPEPDQGYEERLWRQLQPRLRAEAGREHLVQLRMPVPRRRRRWMRAAAAAVLALSIGLVVRPMLAPERLVATSPARQPGLPTTTAISATPNRIIDDAMASHLRRTEAMLVEVLNGDGTLFIVGSAGEAQVLLDDNRLLAAAAARSGDRGLAVFLSSLEPVLLELANQTPDAGIQLDQNGMRDVVRNADLLFQVRAVEAGLKATERRRV